MNDNIEASDVPMMVYESSTFMFDEKKKSDAKIYLKSPEMKLV